MEIRRVSLHKDKGNKSDKNTSYQFTYYNRKNHEIKDKKTLTRIRKLAIPPAYVNVKIAKNPHHYLQAIGEDLKGRKQYIYNPEYVEKNARQKYCNLRIFGRHLGDIRNDVHKLIQANEDELGLLSKDRIIAIAIALMDVCHFRIGNHQHYKNYNSHGVITLQEKHFTIGKDKIDISFIGKKGITNKCTINKSSLGGEALVNLLKKIITKNKKEDFVLAYQTNSGKSYLNPSDIHQFLKKYHPKIMPKMFRTWSANQIFMDEILKKKREIKPLINPKNLNTPKLLKKSERQHQKVIKEIIGVIANKLHNTPTVSKKSYLDNNLIQIYFQNPNKFWKDIERNQKNNENVDKLLTNLMSQNCLESYSLIKDFKTKTKSVAERESQTGGKERKKSSRIGFFERLIGKNLF